MMMMAILMQIRIVSTLDGRNLSKNVNTVLHLLENYLGHV